MDGGSVSGQSFMKTSQRRGDGNLTFCRRISTGIPRRLETREVQVEGTARAMAQRWERADETGD